MELSDNVTVLVDGDRTFYIIGTAHVSADSLREVESLIDALRPDTVCVELCETRYKALTDKDRWKNLDIFKVIREGKTLFLLASLAVGAYQRRLGSELGVQPGAELLAGARKAEEVGATLCLVDRDIQATLKRTWGNIGFFKKMSLLGAIFASMLPGDKDEATSAEQIEELKKNANLSEMMQEFARTLPEVHGPLIDERDRYLISSIEEAPGHKIVAVVGAGHVAGMKRYFGQPQDRSALDLIPPRPWPWKLAGWLVPLLILGAFVFGYFKTQDMSLAEMLTAWVLPNAIFAALLTALVGGKLLSILVAGVASPITSLNPLLGAGMVVGLVEAWLRKPTVEDAERINEDVQSLRGLLRNNFTRVLVVTVAATMGSALGAWVGLGWLWAIVT